MKVRLPTLHEAWLSNGLKVIIGEKSDLPLIYIDVMIKAGAAEDPPALSGLSDLTAELMTRGSKELKADTLDLELDRSGIGLSAGGSYDASFLTITGLSEDCHRMLSIISDLIKHPLFPEEELTDLKRRRSAQLAERENNPSIIASDSIRKILFKDHPYAHPIEGTKDSITKIRIKDIQDFYAKQYIPNRAILLIMGDIAKKDHIMNYCENLFSNWSASQSIHNQVPSPHPARKVKVWLINKPESTQAQIRFGHMGIKRKNPDFFPLQIMNYILGGGGFSSWLMMQIRSVKGYTYGISSGFSPRLGVGPFIISTFTANEKVVDLIEDVLDTINQFIEKGPDKKELEEAKQFYLGNYPLQFDTLGNIAGKLLSVELYDLGKNYIENYTDEIAKVSMKGVKEAARKYLHPEDFHIVIVGKSADYRDRITQLYDAKDL